MGSGFIGMDGWGGLLVFAFGLFWMLGFIYVLDGWGGVYVYGCVCVCVNEVYRGG